MPISQALVTRFFQLIVKRQFAEAMREIDRIKQKMQKTEWNRGYFRALYGIYLSHRKNGDGYAFFSKLDFTDSAALHGYRREFLNHMRNGLHGDFDRGYFSAWADCMRVLIRIDAEKPQKSKNKKAEKKEVETLRTDRSQITMSSYIQKDLAK